MKAKVIIFFDLLPLTHRCSINTQIGDNATDRKRRRFRVRSNINAPLHPTQDFTHKATDRNEMVSLGDTGISLHILQPLKPKVPRSV